MFQGPGLGPNKVSPDCPRLRGSARHGIPAIETALAKSRLSASEMPGVLLSETLQISVMVPRDAGRADWVSAPRLFSEGLLWSERSLKRWRMFTAGTDGT
jgi:hypothetical protein